MGRCLSCLLCALLALGLLLAAPRGARAEPGDVVLVSRSASGEEGNDVSHNPSMSGGGRYLAFESESTNLVPGIVSGTTHIYRKDLASGGVRLCSSSSDDHEGNDDSYSPSISADGTYVFFESYSTNLIPGHPTTAGRKHIFRKDLATGEVMLCSARPDGVEGNNHSGDCECSADGRYVAFESYSTNLIPGHPTTAGRCNIFRKDLASGEVMLCSVRPDGVEGNAESFDPSISPDGRFVTFGSSSSNLLPDTNGSQIYRKDMVTGDILLVSADLSGAQGNAGSNHCSSSAGGRFVAFRSSSTNLIAGHPTTNGRSNIFRKDLQTGEVALCSSTAAGVEGSADSYSPSISADGRYVAFYSLADNLSPGGAHLRRHVLRKDLATMELAACSVSASGTPADGDSQNPDINSDGQFVTFESHATNLVDGSSSAGFEIFRKELAAASSFYFAEGYTGPGFQEYLCLGNPGGEAADVDIAYLFKDGPGTQRTVRVPAASRLTIDVNSEVGAGREVSLRVTSEQTVVAERPVYFDYGAGWTGGHDAVGAAHADTSWYFAEGYTGPGFDEWICVLNPGEVDAELTFRFQTQEAGELVRSGYSVQANSRATFKVNEVLGAGYSSSLHLQSDQPVVAERPMYFDYSGTGGWGWTGGHCVMGTTYLKREYYFAEGYTGPGFEEWLTIQNPNPLAILVTAVYQFADGAEPFSVDFSIPAGTRKTIYVPDEVGENRDVSVKLTSDSLFLAERPMYFRYSGTGGHAWTGGHCVIGASFRRNDLFFAEGYTGPGFEEWLCVQNPGANTAHVRITYFTQEAGALPPREEDIAAGSRRTFNVNEHAGEGYQLSCRLEVLSGPFIVVERPMYFNFQGWTGGHDVVGYGL